MQNRQKKNPIKLHAAKYQIDPWTCRAELIIYSKVKEITIRLMNWEPIASPDAESTQTSGT